MRSAHFGSLEELEVMGYKPATAEDKKLIEQELENGRNLAVNNGKAVYQSNDMYLADLVEVEPLEW